MTVAVSRVHHPVITQKKLSWMAGVLDLRAKKKVMEPASRNKKTTVSIYIEGSELDVIHELCRLTGSQGTFRGESDIGSWERRGCTEHCPEAHFHGTKMMPATGRWQIHGAGMSIVLSNLIHDMVRGEHFIDIMRLGLRGVPRQRTRGWAAVNATVTRLAALGWQIPMELQIDPSIIDGEEDE